jgi:hypothetical protein
MSRAWNKPLDPTLVVCPTCQDIGKIQILGRVLPTGLEVLRFHHGTTIIRTKEYELVCGCGFIFQVSGTVILPSTTLTNGQSDHYRF